MRTMTKTLKNGLKIVFKPVSQLQTVGISFGVRFGSIDENPRINGSAHFLEHMLSKGTKKRTWKQIDDQLTNLGVYNNAFTDHETTVYYMQAYRNYAGSTLEILSDMVKNSTLPEKEFELERGPIINENLMRHDNPAFLIYDYIPQVLYRKHPAKMSVGGDNDKTIKNVQRSDLESIYERNYTPQNSVLSIYGGISASKAFALAEKSFADFERPYERLNRHPAREKQERRSINIVRDGIKQTRFGVGFKCNEFSKKESREFLALSVASSYLSNRLFEEIRQKNGLSYDPMASYNPYSTFGFIASAAGIEPKNLARVRELTLKEFEKLQNGEIIKKDFESAKRSLYIENKIRRDRTLDMAVTMCTFELMYGGVAMMDTIADGINHITVKDVLESCAKYINVDKCGTVLLKPKNVH